MVVLLIVFSLLGAALGAVLLSNATAGVGVICGACLVAVLARIAQASAQHADVHVELQNLRLHMKEMNEREAKRLGPDDYPPIR